MSLILKNNNLELQLPPEGQHLARCYGLIDIGFQKNKNTGNYASKILIAWELCHVLTSANKPFTIMQTYTAHLNQTSKLKALLEAWRGKKFTEEELQEFHLENMLGEPCHLTVIHKRQKENQKYRAIVNDIEPLFPGMSYPTLYHLPLVFDLDYYTEVDYLSLPEKIRKKINIAGI